MSVTAKRSSCACAPRSGQSANEQIAHARKISRAAWARDLENRRQKYFIDPPVENVCAAFDPTEVTRRLQVVEHSVTSSSLPAIRQPSHSLLRGPCQSVILRS